ncbi:MAG: bifunctional diaminohydroxyphosphoribosylaminopyrimidine deaminase/5-amino-6-(5-phosphoribosylamino)uracil reductase RibD [bacterium]|nr:bifunctional diaminohydroxyphosphoribosylaminopyrimidine deaminase/5-amino-6-(5-phosphoribosylamino)uracil reductase RibD [bacterium]
MKRVTPEEWISEALRIAQRGFGKVGPNPMVGAIIVKDDRLIASGAHQRFGGPHAEVVALRKAGDKAHGATLYVTLEPCCHFGKTPPCTDAILKAGIAKVVSTTRDPNPLVSGKGFSTLRKAGVEVVEGVSETEALALNRAYFKHVTSGLPYVIVKIAQSLDGKIATSTGSSQWITGEKSRKFVHQLRASVDAVIVGIGTVLADDPLLNVRLVSGHDPVRIILDSHFRTPPSANVFTTKAPVMICGIAGAEPARQIKLKKAGAEIIELPAADERVGLLDVLRFAASQGIHRILVEGGRDIATAFLRSRIADELIVAIAPKLIGADGRSGFGNLGIEQIDDAIGFDRIHIERFGDDVHLRLQVKQ